MRGGFVLDNEDVRQILAYYFGVDIKAVYKSQYSWIVASDNVIDYKHNKKVAEGITSEE